VFGNIGIAPRTGKTSHINQEGDIVLAKYGAQFLSGFGAVADGVEH
jgi:hypothetical protein